MWKPGTAKPQEQQQTKNDLPSKKSTRKRQEPRNTTMDNNVKTPKSSPAASGMKVPSSSSASPKKRLSGATLNMRFMKRNEETKQNSSPSKGTTSSTNHAKSQSQQQQESHTNYNGRETVSSRPQNDPMDIDENDDESAMDTTTTTTTTTTDLPFSRASPADMYGLQGTIVGRRSFGGFNRAMEDAWKDCKASIENQSSEHRKNKPKVSDEELIQRYKDIVDHRSIDAGSSRPIGNLNRKKKSAASPSPKNSNKKRQRR